MQNTTVSEELQFGCTQTDSKGIIKTVNLHKGIKQDDCLL